MRAKSPSDGAPGDLRRAIGRLVFLPMRPASASQALALALDEDSEFPSAAPMMSASTATDPAWVVAASRLGGRNPDLLATLAVHGWWPASASTGPIAECLTRLWRHSMAVSFASRKLAKEAGDPDPEVVARAGLLHGLGLWAIAAVWPESLVAWYDAANHATRLDLERRWLGVEASSLGRSLALRWGCESLVVDAAWLHADLEADLNGGSDQPERLALVQQAYAMAATTPWAPGAGRLREAGTIDPRVRVLTAEVQARSGGVFVDPDASPREERLTIDHARLKLDHARLVAERGSTDRFLKALVESSPEEGPDAWADRASLAWCGEPGVLAARVDWCQSDMPPGPTEITWTASRTISLGDQAQPSASVHLWGESKESIPVDRPPIAAAWDAWAARVDERERLTRRLDEVVSAHRGRVARESSARRRMMLEALAEFAAGAGHELNNPLAVIVGRAQLLLAKEDDPEAIRSLRAIIAQAQRAARILRDLMYVARPPEPRPRPCQPDEIVRACLRDLQEEAETRGVRIVAETRDPGLRVWADPEPLRQLADILARNALEATPSGGLVQFAASGDTRGLRWTVHDNGKGIGPGEGLHLFDPFYCGRTAGRGLGLGLPRAARIVSQVGGDLKWQSSPGSGTTFVATLPVSEIPEAPEELGPGGSKPDRALPTR